MPHLSRVDRVRGCLLGLAVGDALGAPLEGLSSQQIKSHYGRVKNYVDGVQAWKRKPYRWRLRGLYTDDTQQALALCDILLEHGRVDQERLADLYLSLATPKGPFLGAHRGIGRSFRQVLAALESGVPAHLAGQPGAGIGAAMRIAPVPLYFGDDPDALFDAVIAASLMTHRDIRSLSGAMAVSHTIRRLVAGEPRDPSLLLWVASDLVKDEKRIAGEHAAGGHQARRTRALPAADHRPRRVDPRPAARPRPGGPARRGQPPRRRTLLQAPHPGLPACMHPDVPLSLAHDRQLRGSRGRCGQPRRRCRHGRGDPGGDGGAYYGVDDIPKRWLDGLQNRDGIDARALALAQGSADGLDIPDLVATERELTRKESEALEQFMSLARGGGDRDANRVF